MKLITTFAAVVQAAILVQEMGPRPLAGSVADRPSVPPDEDRPTTV